MKAIKEMNEQDLREYKELWPKSIGELSRHIQELIERPHDYGTCVYAMSLASCAAFNYVAHKLEVTGFQASCADIDFISRTRSMKNGFKILDFENLLYPQYLNEEHFPGYAMLIEKHKESLKASAEKLLEESPNSHPEVIAHWKKLSGL